MNLSALGIRSRMLLLGILPAVLVLVAVLTLNFLRLRGVLLDFGHQILLDRVRAVAAEIDRDTLEAVTATRVMAIAVEQGFLGRRAEAVEFVRDVLDSFPQFTGASIGLEPGADGPDAATAADVPPEAIGADGRFLPYWFRDPTNRSRLRLAPLVMLDGLYYAGCRERFLDSTQSDKAIVAEPYVYQGQAMVEQSYPVVIDGRFAGITSVDRTLDGVEATLAAARRRQRDAGWHVEVFLVSRLGRMIASTVPREDLQTRPIEESAYGPILADFHAAPVSDRVVEGRDPLTGASCLYAGAKIPTGAWTVVMQMPRSDLVGRVQGPLLTSAALATTGMAAALGLIAWLTGRISRRIGTAVAASRRVAQGDLSGAVDLEGSDETGQLLRDIGGMTASLRAIVAQVKRASLDLHATARQLSAAGRQQETAIAALGASTSEAAVASRQITATGRELLATMREVADVAGETAHVAAAGRGGLAEVGESMTLLQRSTAAFSERLELIRRRAEDINVVITTITKVADQTNLLSINAAIEAEKAGEFGHGFIVVAREIRRLADQTAVATLDIERLVEQMQQAVNAGVEEMDRFTTEVRTGVERVGGISGQFADVIEKVHGLSDRFDQVRQGMQTQAAGAQQINDALTTLDEGSRAAGEALREFKDAAQHMVTAVDGLTETVSRFRLDDDRAARRLTVSDRPGA
jgi:methyl-accepting chemotaxis protein